MLDILKKTMFAGIGLALKTKSEAEEIAREFAKKAEMSENDGKGFVGDFLKRYDDSRQKFEEKVETVVKDVLNKAHLATKDELSEIKKEIETLKNNL